MAINVGESPAGVNVNVAGAVSLEHQHEVNNGTCTPALAGTFEVEEGCFYFCDGSFRQSFNVAFYSDSAGEGAKACKHVDRCYFDGIWLRPGDKVEAYNAIRHADCDSPSVKQVITCGVDNFEAFPHSYCMPWDGTDVGIIEELWW